MHQRHGSDDRIISSRIRWLCTASAAASASAAATTMIAGRWRWIDYRLRSGVMQATQGQVRRDAAQMLGDGNHAPA
jgi:hypothetical protein